MSGVPWDASYHDGTAPWDIGRPQPAIVRVASEGGFAGAVLDPGCGTGENALYIASLGLSVLGVDVAETALAIAQAKAEDRGIEVEFAAADAFQLERLGRKFETVLDCGLFHTFDADERPRYVASLASVTEQDGTVYVLCFSDDGPDTGPHPISKDELRAAFNRSNGWNVTAIEPDRVQTRNDEDGAPAWFATVKRIWTAELVSPVAVPWLVTRCSSSLEMASARIADAARWVRSFGGHRDRSIRCATLAAFRPGCGSAPDRCRRRKRRAVRRARNSYAVTIASRPRRVARSATGPPPTRRLVAVEPLNVDVGGGGSLVPHRVRDRPGGQALRSEREP
jgi:SAM-dependent methyltransferase